MTVFTTTDSFGSSGRWLKYLVLSLLANLLIASAIPIDKRTIAASHETPMLKIKLMSLAVPTAMPDRPYQLESLPVPVEKVVTQVEVLEKTTLCQVPATTVALLEPSENETKCESAFEVISDDGEEEVSTVIHEAKYRIQTPPKYPRRALELGQEGTVILHAKVASDGLPCDLKVADSSGYRLLDRAAFVAVEEWEFEPMNMNDNVVACWVRVPVRFVIR